MNALLHVDYEKMLCSISLKIPNASFLLYQSGLLHFGIVLVYLLDCSQILGGRNTHLNELSGFPFCVCMSVLDQRVNNWTQQPNFQVERSLEHDKETSQICLYIAQVTLSYQAKKGHNFSIKIVISVERSLRHKIMFLNNFYR